MVNVDFSPALVLGMGLIGGGLTLYQLRRFRPGLSRDFDVIVSSVAIFSGGILVFQGWRLDPLLLFCQLLTAGMALAFAVETLRLRDEVAGAEGGQDPPVLDARARYAPPPRDTPAARGRGLPPPEGSQGDADFYARWDEGGAGASYAAYPDDAPFDDRAPFASRDAGAGGRGVYGASEAYGGAAPGAYGNGGVYEAEFGPAGGGGGRGAGADDGAYGWPGVSGVEEYPGDAGYEVPYNGDGGGAGYGGPGAGYGGTPSPSAGGPAPRADPEDWE